MLDFPKEYESPLRFLEEDAAASTNMKYHYTNEVALVGILGKNEFWLSHYKDLEDKSEITHALELCRRVILMNQKEENTSLFGKIYL
jgi:hypothetical protein